MADLFCSLFFHLTRYVDHKMKKHLPKYLLIPVALFYAQCPVVNEQR